MTGAGQAAMAACGPAPVDGQAAVRPVSTVRPDFPYRSLTVRGLLDDVRE